jgi:hypothetical protein
MSFFKNREQVGKSGPVWALVPVGEGRNIRKGCGKVNMVEYYVLMYENGKMRPVETLPGMGGGRIKENDGGGEFNCDIL